VTDEEAREAVRSAFAELNSLFGGWALAGLGPGYVVWLVSAAAALSAAAAHALPRCPPLASGPPRLAALSHPTFA
jgi:hypothetical protein